MKALAYNVAALDKVLGLATQVGDSYKPGNASIERTALAALLEESRKSVTAVLKAEGDLVSAINRRQRAFETLPLLGMQIMGLAESGGMGEKDLQDLDKIRKRFRSQPFKGTAQDISPDGQAMPTEVSVPSSETAVRKNRILSYDSKVVTLESLIKFLEERPAYNPTEPFFSIESLKEKLAELSTHNTAIINAKSELIRVRGEAKKLIFDRTSGIFGKARMTKRYLRTILGRNDELYKSISKVKFKTK
jgi:hypothetical protein